MLLIAQIFNVKQNDAMKKSLQRVFNKKVLPIVMPDNRE